MATYKVIQDIEAEDKLLGPLSLRQFIYAVIVVALGFIMFTLGKVNPIIAVPFLPPLILFGFLAAPFGHDQSSEVWLLAKIRFILKPRARVWNQAGLQELVTITAPKKVERVLTNGLDQYQVQSRLQALARTIDTRGWAVKGVDMNTLAFATSQVAGSDRLVGMQSFAQDVPDYDVNSQDDILDADNNAVAQQVDQMIEASSAAHRQALMARMSQGDTATVPQYQAAQPTTPQTVPMYAPQPVTNSEPVQPVYSTPVPTMPAPPQQQSVPQQVSSPSQSVPTADEAALLEQIHEQDARDADALKRMHVLEKNVPAPATAVTTPESEAVSSSVTQTPDAGIIELANNDDLTVATIARQAHKHDPQPNDEVVISLH